MAEPMSAKFGTMWATPPGVGTWAPVILHVSSWSKLRFGRGMWGRLSRGRSRRRRLVARLPTKAASKAEQATPNISNIRRARREALLYAAIDQRRFSSRSHRRPISVSDSGLSVKMVLGRLTHYAFDAVLFSAFLAGMKRSTGLSFKRDRVAGENTEVSKWVDKYLGVGEWVMDQSVAIAGSSGWFERNR